VTPEAVKQFETLLDMFGHPGWQVLMEEFDFKIDSIKEGFTSFGITPELLAFGQGRISVYRELQGLPTLLRNALEEKDVEETPV
jgi:hypothetical protein